MKSLDSLDRQMSVGQVKTIMTGSFLNYVELLFSPTTKVQLAPSDDNKSVILVISDTSLDFPESSCIIKKDTLRDYFIAIRKLYNQLEIDKEENDK